MGLHFVLQTKIQNMSGKIIRYFDSNKDSLEEVILLGDKNSKTLGHLPHDAYKDYLRRQGILICKIDDQIGGYCLFRRQRKNNQIKIAQLCVDESFRGKKIADELLDFIKNEFREHFRGIALNCRRDYEQASTVWKRNHFFPLEERRSRSKDENYLLQWYFDFNQVDLFNSVSNSKIKALLDLNIVIKLRDLKEGQEIQDEEIKYLFNDDILTEVEYFFARESLAEITRDNDTNRRKETRKLLKEFKQLDFHPDEFRFVYDKVLELAPPKCENDYSDRKQLTEAIANNIPFFITTDRNLKKACKIIEEHFNITISLPSEFIIHFDQIQNSSTFLPRRLGGVAFEIKKLNAETLDQATDEFFNREIEKKSDFRKYLNAFSSKLDTEVKIVYQNEKLLALLGYSIIEKVCKVEILRLKNSSIKYVLFSQLITEVIRVAIEAEVNEIQLACAPIDDEMEKLLMAFRFFRRDDHYIKIVMSGFFTSIELLSNKAIQEVIKNDFRSKPIHNEQKYELERVVYPGKIKDLDIQNLIIPIKPYWASQLFEHHLSNYSLFGANEKLQWNRENVYFRSVKPNIERYPARILWYVSSSDSGKYGNRTKSIVACSYLESINIDQPSSLFSQFKKIGIYDWANIHDLAKKNLKTAIKAIIFSDTEVFKNSVPLPKIQQILEKRHTFQSPIVVSTDVFFSIYSLK